MIVKFLTGCHPFLHVKNAACGGATGSIFHINYSLLSDLSRGRHQQNAAV